MSDLIVVVVDAENVRRSLWPNISEERLVELCESWAEENGARAVVVFDGKAPGEVLGEREESPFLTLVGSGTETADDWIERAAAAYAAEGRRFWLVTSDRALREAAGREAERVVGGGSFARELQSAGSRR